MNDINTVVTSVGDILDVDLSLDIRDAPACDHRHKHLRHVRQSLQHLLGSRGEDSQVWVGAMRSKGAIIVKQKTELGPSWLRASQK